MPRIEPRCPKHPWVRLPCPYCDGFYPEPVQRPGAASDLHGHGLGDALDAVDSSRLPGPSRRAGEAAEQAGRGLLQTKGVADIPRNRPVFSSLSRIRAACNTRFGGSRVPDIGLQNGPNRCPSHSLMPAGGTSARIRDVHAQERLQMARRVSFRGIRQARHG
jgi:hypothetical protein